MKKIKQAKRQAKRLYRFCLIDGLLDEGRVRRVVQEVLEAKRRGGLMLAGQFLRLVKLDRARHTAEVASAAELPADLQASIRSRLEQAYGSGVRASFTEDPALIGGMRIKVGSDVYDGSVRGRLAELARSF